MPKAKIPVKGSGLSKGSVSNSTALTTGLGSSDFYLPFFHYLTIPKNTTEVGYVSHTLTLPISQVHKIWIEFPRGCAGLVGVQVWRKVEQIFPLPLGVWLRSDAYTFSFNFTHLIDAEPYNVEFRGYNLDDTYEHTVWIGLELRGLFSETTPQLQSFIDLFKG